MIQNQIKTVLLLGVLSGLLLGIGFFIGGQQGLIIAFIFAILMNFGSFLYSHKLVLFMYKAKLAKKEDYPKLHEMVEEISLKAKIPKPKIYVIPTQTPNAMATGPTYKKAVVACTQGILGLLNEDELKGVLAHEIAHIKNRDVLISTIAATIASVITYIAFMARWAAIFGGFGRDGENNNIVAILALAILTPIIAMIIQLAISRSREFIADETGSRFIGQGEPLASALEKLHSENNKSPLKLGNQATNSMFIVNPFRGSGQFFAKIFSTHPDVKQRIKKLRELKIY
ncbi:protease HtpX [archaeon]|nr:protease HtpX [archaeon]|tara:strand:- start:3331 stop:4188 length:858 start_codon:yes stop_codon:yes gene_type:complete